MTSYVNNPSDNSGDWSAAVTGAGGVVNASYDFEAVNPGDGVAELNAAYGTSIGVTLSATGEVGGVVFGAGPADGNDAGALPGEGVHASSNHLVAGSDNFTLTFTFDAPVVAAGIFVIDQYDSASSTPGIFIEAFAGENGTGGSLGSAGTFEANFQSNNLLFLGLTSDTGFRSFVVRDVNSATGDIVGFDNLMFAAAGATSEVPLPAAGLLLPAALGGLALARRRRKS
ncbi:VPLPA-CTERM sorting domain-containing protein [Albimonas donghaensis]|uniref:VPLPA-CTERM sorting domain-containing protein n=1 Tax=Albimonas donghaensis TaxID=356660 RepID=UPI00115FFE0A|nr:VPLPA-CTERM sorting domain-containing protein [Albimonas donghaensis]